MNEGPKEGNNCVEITIQRGMAKQLRALAAAWKTPEDQVHERLIRSGLDAYWAEHRVDCPGQGTPGGLGPFDAAIAGVSPSK